MPRKTKRPTNPTPEPPLRLEWRSPAELAEHPSNWRRHPEAQLSALTDVIADVGWAGACLFNERTGRLIDGHARRKVALDQGADKVPVLIGDWSEADEAKILATLDPLAAMAEADAGALKALLDGMQTSSQAVADMLTKLAEASGMMNVGESAMPELPSGDKAPFQQMTFTIHDTQAVLIDAAISRAKAAGPFGGPNENSNGNALARICEAYRG